MQMNTGQTVTPKTPQQFERLKQIIAAYRENLSKPCGMTKPSRAKHRVGHASGLTELRIRNHKVKERQLWSASNKAYQEQMAADVERSNKVRMKKYV